MSVKYFRWIIVIVIFLVGCGSTRPKIKIAGYSFDYEGETYHIEGVTPNFIEGYNIITRNEGEDIVFKGIDKEQDGFLDEVVIGDIPLEKAKEIYRAGVIECRKEGHIIERRVVREYKTRIGHRNYILTTHILTLGGLYNKLVIGFFSENAVILDMGADGILDEMEKGEESLGHYQEIYRMILNKGMDEGKVVEMEGLYIVEK